MKSRWRRRVLLMGGGLLIVVLAANRWSLPWLARWLDVGGVPQRADAVVLLNGSLNTRPLVAAALVHGGWAPRVLLGPVAAHASQASGAVPPCYELNKQMLAYGGIPGDCVDRLDCEAKTTFDEAEAVARYVQTHTVRKLMIVTEGPHSRRARWIFEKVLAGRPVEIVMISGPADEFDNENWWRSEAGFLYVMSEHFKLFYYWLRYGWLGYELVGGLAAIVILRAWFSRRRQLIQRNCA